MGIGPSTKETSLHHFRDPLLSVVSADDDLDLMGIILVGTPDVSEDKLRVSTRAAVMAAAMRPDGVITSTDGWGNSDVDYCNMVEQVGRQGIPVTGLHFTGTCGRFVVSNDFLGNILDMDDIVRLAKEYQVDGVIDLNLKFCTLYDTEGRLVERRLKEEGIPCLGLETDYTDNDAEQLRTRVEAFLELLRG